MTSASAKAHPLGRPAAFSFLEVLAAGGLVAVFLVGAFTANSRGLYMIRCAKETAAASKILQQRMEQLRAASWPEVTDAASLQGIFAVAANAAPSVTTTSEKVTIAPWPVLVGASKIQVTRSSSGTAAVAADNVDLVDAPTVLVTAQVVWTGAGNRTRTRETCTVIANGGLGR